MERTTLVLAVLSFVIVIASSFAFGCDCGMKADLPPTDNGDTGEEEVAVCSECGSANVIPIIYGKPGQELIEKAERGEVKLGGCVVSRESPYNYCKDCKAEW
jgi:hypothetical protein